MSQNYAVGTASPGNRTKDAGWCGIPYFKLSQFKIRKIMKNSLRYSTSPLTILPKFPPPLLSKQSPPNGLLSQGLTPQHNLLTSGYTLTRVAWSYVTNAIKKSKGTYGKPRNNMDTDIRHTCLIPQCVEINGQHCVIINTKDPTIPMQQEHIQQAPALMAASQNTGKTGEASLRKPFHILPWYGCLLMNSSQKSQVIRWILFEATCIIPQ